MTGSAYRELERQLTRTLAAFDSTRLKLNGFERGCRDRASALLADVARKRHQNEVPPPALIVRAGR